MASGALPLIAFLLLLVGVIAGSKIEKMGMKLPSDSIKQVGKIGEQEPLFPFSFHKTATRRDTYPTPFPNSPSTETPTVNPTPPSSTDSTSPPAFTIPLTPTPTEPNTRTPTVPITSTTPTMPITPTAPLTPTTTPTASSGGSWCVASQSASETALQVALDYACGYGGADCSTIQQGGSCYDPNTVHDHASYAFNDYYQKNPAPTSCDFGGAAQITNTDPSTGSCHYASGGSSQSTPPSTPTAPVMQAPTVQSPPSQPISPVIDTPTDQSPPSQPASPVINTPMDQSPPSPSTPLISTTPYGETYGEEPSGSPNIANRMEYNSIFILTIYVTLTYMLQTSYP